MSQAATAIFKKISSLEQQFQKVKVQAFLSLPPKVASGLYDQNEINQALKTTRNQIWQKRYAKKLKGLS